jgi:hypothetical protein
MLNSGPVDWFTSLKFGLSLNFFVFYTIPIPIYESTARQLRIGELAAGLALVEGANYGEWTNLAKPILDPKERIKAMAEVDYLSCLEFGLGLADAHQIFGSGNSQRSSISDVLSFGSFKEK